MPSVKDIMNADAIGEELVRFADQTGERLSRDLKRAQIRTLFAEARKVEAQWETTGEAAAMRQLNMLKPKLAYQAKRNPAVGPLQAVLTEAIEEVAKAASGEPRQEKFQRFMDLFEAILAYHRYHGGN
jgi:CRISPR-associated protein Csm2